MKWAAMLVIAALGGLLTWSASTKMGDRQQTPVVLAASKTPVTVSAPAESGATVNLRAGDRFAVEAEGNPSTGYAWQIIEQPAFCQPVKTLPSEAKGDGEDRVGAPTRLTFVFECKSTGEGTLAMEYRRPWEKDNKADKTFRIIVRVT